jgi:hypothetical protein
VAATRSSPERAPTNVAWAVAAYICLESPVYVLVAVGRGKGRLRQVASAFKGPLLVGVVSAAAAFAAARAIPPFRLQAFTQLAAGGAAAALAFFVASATLERPGWDALTGRLSALLNRRAAR